MRPFLLSLALLFLSVSLRAQELRVRLPAEEMSPWATDVSLLSVNALIGGLTAGVAQAVRGGSFADGFSRGSLGGALTFAGKRIAVERFDGAGLLGRQVAAVGGSVVRNASEGRSSLERVMLPLGPVRTYLSFGEGPRLRAKVDLHTLFWVGVGVLEPEMSLDVGASLSAGAPVFRAPGHYMSFPGGFETGGYAPAGVIFMGEVWDDAWTLSHERVHVLQDDQFFLMIADPAEEWLLERVPGGRTLGRFVDLNATSLLFIPTAFLLPHDERPWEIEANLLAR